MNIFCSDHNSGMSSKYASNPNHSQHYQHYNHSYGARSQPNQTKNYSNLQKRNFHTNYRPNMSSSNGNPNRLAFCGKNSSFNNGGNSEILASSSRSSYSLGDNADQHDFGHNNSENSSLRHNSGIQYGSSFHSNNLNESNSNTGSPQFSALNNNNETLNEVF